jgi:hypothetical protein
MRKSFSASLTSKVITISGRPNIAGNFDISPNSDLNFLRKFFLMRIDAYLDNGFNLLVHFNERQIVELSCKRNKVFEFPN